MFVHTYFTWQFFTNSYFPGADPFGVNGVVHIAGMIKNPGTLMGRR